MAFTVIGIVGLYITLKSSYLVWKLSIACRPSANDLATLDIPSDYKFLFKFYYGRKSQNFYTGVQNQKKKENILFHEIKTNILLEG